MFSRFQTTKRFRQSLITTSVKKNNMDIDEMFDDDDDTLFDFAGGDHWSTSSHKSKSHNYPKPVNERTDVKNSHQREYFPNAETRSTDAIMKKTPGKQIENTAKLTSHQGTPSAAAATVKPPVSANKKLIAAVPKDAVLVYCTSTTSYIKEWKRYRDEIQMIVEIFGVLESVKQDLRYPSGKWLRVVDQRNVLDCVYYEIDTELPILALKQWIRCVGTIQRDGSLFCISVRPATQQEQQWRNKLSSLGAKAMYTRMANLNES